MNIDDFGIFFLQNFEIYHFSKKNLKISLFKISKCRFFFQNQNFQNSKFASDHTETFPDAPVQSKIAYWNQPQNFSPAALLLPRVPPLFQTFPSALARLRSTPCLGGCFLRGSEKIQMREFFDFQIFNFQIFRFGILPKYSKETPNHQIRSRSVFPLLYRRVQIHLCIEFKKFLFFLHF